MTRPHEVMPRTIRAAMAAATLVFAAAGARGADIVAKLSESVVPERPFVSLGEVAEIVGDGALAERAAKVLLGRSPDPGCLRTISRNYVLSRLAAEGVDLSRVEVVGEKGVRLRVPRPASSARDATATRRHGGDRISEADRTRLAREIAEACARRAGFGADEVEVELTDVRLSGGGFEPGSLMVSSVLGRRGLGRVTAALTGTAGGVMRSAGVAHADVAVVRKVLAPARCVRRGERLSEEDIRVVTVALRGVPGDYVQRPEIVLGKEASRDLSAGEPLRSSAVREPELVRRGEIVTVRARGPGFRMTDRGTARDSGCLGKVVVVENPRSRKVFPAIVTGPRTVRPLTADEILITDGKGR